MGKMGDEGEQHWAGVVGGGGAGVDTAHGGVGMAHVAWRMMVACANW